MPTPAIATAKIGNFPKMDVYAELQKMRNLRPIARYANEKKRRADKVKKWCLNVGYCSN